MKTIITGGEGLVHPAAEAVWREFGVTKEEVLFVDIETTGLSARSAAVYEIGTAYVSDSTGEWEIRQWLCSHRREEKEMLRQFFTFAGRFRLLVHFNGTTFDLPFLKARGEKFGGLGKHFDPESAQMKSVLDDCASLDLYRRFHGLASLLGLPDRKQKTFEGFLGIQREDTMDGGRLIPVWDEYEQSGDVKLEHFLLIHNEEDMKGLLRLTDLFACTSLLRGEFTILSHELNQDRSFGGQEICEAQVFFRLDQPLRRKFFISEHGFYFSAEGERGKAVLPLVRDTLKYFYPDYRNYYYLPREDTAVHKSVGELVDRDFRKKATAATCYIKKEGLFFLTDKQDDTPCFYREYKGKERFVLYNENVNAEDLKHAILFQIKTNLPGRRASV